MPDFALLNNQALALYNAGKTEAAEKITARILKSDSQNYSALLTAGNIRYLAREYQAALDFYRRAEQSCPGDAAALINQGNALLELKDFKTAADCAKKVLKTDSRHPAAWALLAYVDFAAEDYAAAEKNFAAAIKQDETNFWLHNYLGQAAQKCGRFDAALKASYQAVKLSGGADSQQVNFAYALYEIALEKGRDFVRDWQRCWEHDYPGSKIVKYVCAALDSRADLPFAEPDYVRCIFDFYAEDFEQSLHQLGYCVPQKTAAVFAGLPLPGNRILDLGCGTGWVGKCLKEKRPDWVVDGVDLSSGMLREAAAKNIYNRLTEDNIQHFLPQLKAVYDGVAAADVLTYFGELETLFGQVAGALKKEGCFVFSVSKNTLGGEDFRLHLSGRFLHRREYVEKVLRQSGFRLLSVSGERLRSEGGRPVEGWIFAACRI